jgi:hypothetical protein
LRQEVERCRRDIKKLESDIRKAERETEGPVSTEGGPIVRGLENALKSFNVERQAYWSGAFVGNHVHRTLKVKLDLKNNIVMNVDTHTQPENTKKLCEVPVQTLRASCPELLYTCCY